MRERAINQFTKPKTILPSTSGLVYWQIENEDSILDGSVVHWGQQIKFRHMVTRRYLCVNDSNDLDLITNSRDPRTVFRLYPVKKENDEICYESYARIEHELSGRWLHALKSEEFIPRKSENALENLTTDENARYKVCCRCFINRSDTEVISFLS